MIIPVSQSYVATVMLASPVAYNKTAMFLIIILGTALGLLCNALFGLLSYRFFCKFISPEGQQNMNTSRAFIHKYCLLFVPFLSFISPLLLIVFSVFCGFLKLLETRVMLAILIEIVGSAFQKVFIEGSLMSRIFSIGQ